MKKKKEVLDLLMPVALFWVVMSYFIATTPNYLEEHKSLPQVKKTQSVILEKYGELFTKNQ